MAFIGRSESKGICLKFSEICPKNSDLVMLRSEYEAHIHIIGGAWSSPSPAR
jgi:hypothetical protein